MNTSKWTHFAALFLAWEICVPTIMVGYELCKSYGYGAALATILVGNILLFSISLVMIHLSTRLRIPTLAVAIRIFGTRGKAIFTFTMVSLMIGWFAIQLDAMSGYITLLGSSIIGYSVPTWIINLVMGFIITASAATLLNNISIFAMVMLLPFTVTIVLALMKTSMSYNSFFAFSPSTFGTKLAGIALVLAGDLAFIIDLPTFIRNSRSKADAVKGLFATFIIGVPLIELIGIFFAVSASSGTLTEKLLAGDVTWKVWVTLCFIISTWLTCVGNLYSAMVSLKTVISRYSTALFISFGGIMGTILACAGVSERFGGTLDVMGIFMTSMGSIIILWYVTILRKWKENSLIAFIAWATGFICGLANAFGIFSLTQTALIDAGLIASSSYIFLNLGAWLVGSCYKK